MNSFMNPATAPDHPDFREYDAAACRFRHRRATPWGNASFGRRPPPFSAGPASRARTPAGLIVAAEAQTGAEALALVEREEFDIILMDVNLPDNNGIEVSRRILEMRRDARIIILSTMPILRGSTTRCWLA